MNQPKVLPVVTPEMVAALANLIIEDRFDTPEEAIPPGSKLYWMAAFKQAAEVEFDKHNARHNQLLNAAINLARRLNFPAPYLCEVRNHAGELIQSRRRTLTYFYESEGFSQSDCAAVCALETGATFVVNGAEATMTVSRMD